MVVPLIWKALSNYEHEMWQNPVGCYRCKSSKSMRWWVKLQHKSIVVRRTRTFTQRNGFARTNKPIEICRISVPLSKCLSRIDFGCISKNILHGLSMPIQPSQKIYISRNLYYQKHIYLTDQSYCNIEFYRDGLEVEEPLCLGSDWDAVLMLCRWGTKHFYIVYIS